MLSPSEKYTTESFLPAVDQFVASLDQRLQTKLQLKNLITSYPDDLDISFVDELT